MELFLIDVQPDADDGLDDVSPFQFVLYQDAAYFLVFPVDVIRPFDGEAVGVVLQGIDY